MVGPTPIEHSPPLHKQTVENVMTPNGEIVLRRVTVGDDRVEHEIIFNGVFLMATYCGRSSTDLMSLALAREQTGREQLHVLIGGLGMAFTLRRALSDERVDRVTVVEIEPAIARWNREYLGNDPVLEDDRTTLVVEPFLDHVRQRNHQYDVIVCDIDNGPTWLVMPNNAELYRAPALRLLNGRLPPGGAICFWSHERVASFEDQLARVVGPVEARQSLDVHPTGRTLESFLVAATKAS